MTIGLQGAALGQQGANPPHESPQSGGHPPSKGESQVGSGQQIGDGHCGSSDGQHIGTVKLLNGFGDPTHMVPDNPSWHLLIVGRIDKLPNRQ